MMLVIPKRQNLSLFFLDFAGQLEYVNFDNVFIAGGSILAALRAPSFIESDEYFRTGAYKQSDIDIFLYGLTPVKVGSRKRWVLLHIRAGPTNTRAPPTNQRTTHRSTGERQGQRDLSGRAKGPRRKI
jgi:hypothetical protein